MKLMYFAKYRFELFLFVCLVGYGLLYLTPSSYGLALNLFGMPGEGLLWGKPRGIRSDEWTVWTPYMQSLVNNGFGRFNELSMYREDFRGFNALPIHDWALFFKPQMWPFLVFEPARAFSLHHGIIIVAFLIGWKQLFQYLLADKPYASNLAFVLFSLMLFFSSFSQVWWTTLGPLLAATPWLLLTVLKWRRDSVFYYLLLVYVSAVFLLSHTYPPIIITVAYFGVLLLLIHQKSFFSSPSRFAFTAIACAVGTAIAYAYYHEIISIMSNTVYPGQRVSLSGEVGWVLWLSAIVPYITHSNNQDLMGLNICEIGAAASLLPILAACYLDYRKLTKTDFKILAICSVFLLFFSLWMLAPLPNWIGTSTLLSMVPGRRMLFIVGLVVNYAALYALVSAGVKFSATRHSVFFVSLLAIWLLPSVYSDIELFKKSGWEILAIVLLVCATKYLPISSFSRKTHTMGIVAVAFVINFIYFFDFNPGQSSRPIFDVASSDVIAKLKQEQEQDPRGWLVKPGYPGAILSGAGFNPITTVLIQPQLAFFRELFPEMPEGEFNQVFNRYAHIHLYNKLQPAVPQPDVVQIPIHKVVHKGEQQPLTYFEGEFTGVKQGGFIEVSNLQGNFLTLKGWYLSSAPKFFTNINSTSIYSYISQTRQDVVQAYQDDSLAMSGFHVVIEVPDEALTTLRQEGVCLVTEDLTYGTRLLTHLAAEGELACKRTNP